MKNLILTLLLIIIHTSSFAQGIEDTKTNKTVEVQIIEHTEYHIIKHGAYPIGLHTN